MYEVNLDKILSDQRTPEYIKSAILQSRLTGHLTLEEFLRSISNKSLNELQNLLDSIRLNNSAMEAAMICTMALTTIDGVYMETAEEIVDMLKTLISCVTLESLFRKGLVQVNREQFTFLYDPKAVIATITPEGHEFIKNINKENKCKTITTNQTVPTSVSTQEAFRSLQKPSETPQSTGQLSLSHTRPKTLWQRFLNLFRK